MSSVAEIIAAGDPVVWRRLLTAHTADHLGHCRCCGLARWPCSLHDIAAHAARICADRSRTRPHW